MRLKEKANLIIYRCREKGLEIFMLNKNNSDQWELPTGKVQKETNDLIEEDFIPLDPVSDEMGEIEQGFAVEGEWHDIPSLKAILYEDMLFLKDKIKEVEGGTFVAFKEAFKKVLPHQYEMLKELKEIVTDRNSLKDL